MSKILCIIDGMSDPGFDGERYPALASFPIRGSVQTVPDGFEAETLPCVLSLLGNPSPPRNIRGWIEALGAGVQVGREDLVFRGSWVGLDGGGRCVGFCDAPDNIPAMKQIRYIPLGGYKCLLLIPGYASHVDAIQVPLPFEMLGKNIRDFVCPHIPPLKDALALLGHADATRGMIPWAASAPKPLPPFPGKAAVVSGTNVIRGLAKALHMRSVSLDGMTGDTDTNLNAKVRVALALAGEYPFVMLHIGGCDEAAHRMSKTGKEAFLSQVDKIVLSRLLLSEHGIEVVSDHGADPETGGHVGGWQPVFHRPK